jgi:WD40 repeat protein
MDLSSSGRHRLLGSVGDLESSILNESLFPDDIQQGHHSQRFKQLNNIFSNNIFLDDEWHAEDYLYGTYDDGRMGDSSWRLKEKMRTVGLALVLCLNIGVDPPDVVKPNPCAKKECWFDPTNQRQKGLDIIGNALQQQYEKYDKVQSKTKYKQCLDPTSEDLRKVLINLRKVSKSERLLLHYNGHGVPKPTKNGELWVFGRHYTHYTPVSVSDVKLWLGDPAIYVLDCSAAGILIPHLVDVNAGQDHEQQLTESSEAPTLRQNSSGISFVSQSSEGNTVVFAACKGNEQLPFHPLYPADLFTSCLTTPVTIAIRWFILHNPHSMKDLNPDIAETIPGKDTDRNSPRGELNWILTAITDTIAWNILPARKFQKLFRMDSLLASLYRNFLVAQRIMKSFRCTPQSWPDMPDSTTHPLWQSWDMALETFLTQYTASQKFSSVVHAKNNLTFNMPTNLTFFNDQLSAFEMWLEFGTASLPSPPMLPVVLQVLLSKTHRVRVLTLLKRFLSLGTEAVRLSLILGIFPYVLKLLKNPSDDIKHLVISVWSSIIGFDPTCRQELVRDKVITPFIQDLNASNLAPAQRCLSAFVLAEVCNRNREGQQACLQLGLHRECARMLPLQDVMSCATLKLWTSLSLYKLCEDFVWAKYLCITEAGHTRLYPLLVDSDSVVRASAILALGELFGASSLSSSVQAPLTPGSINFRQRSSLGSASEESHRNSMSEEIDLREAELQLALQILECCTDGSVIVRLESVSALSKFFIQAAHIDCFKLIAKAVYVRNTEKKTSKLGDRRSASPASDNGMGGGFNRLALQCPWHLTPIENEAITNQLVQYLKENNDRLAVFDASSVSNGVQPLQLPSEVRASNPSAAGQVPAGLATPGAPSAANSSFPPSSSTDELITLMASTYVRLWLALTEVAGKDPHCLVSQAATDICFRIHALIALDERQTMNTSPDMTAKFVKTPSGNEIGPGAYWAGGFSNNNSSNNLASMGTGGDLLHPPLSPMGAFATPIRARGFKFTGASSVPRGVSSSLLSESFNTSSPDISREATANSASLGGRGIVTPSSSRSGGGSVIQRPPTATPGNANAKGNNTANSFQSGGQRFYFAEAFKDHVNLIEEDLTMHFSTNLYEMARKEFLEYGQEFDPHADVLSGENRDRAYRLSRLQEVLGAAKYYRELFQDSEDRYPGDGSYDNRKGVGKQGVTDDNFMRTKSPALVTVPSNVVKFEQDNTIKLGGSIATSQLMFHAFQDVLVVASGSTAQVWSLQSKARILEIKNQHSVRGLAAEGSSNPSLGTHKIPAKSGSESAQSPVFSAGGHNPATIYGGANYTYATQYGNAASSRITSMTWINESYDSLLVLGSDDGVVRVWRDVANSDSIAALNAANANANNGIGNPVAGNAGNNITTGGVGGTAVGAGSPGLLGGMANVEQATAFSALPDIAETSRGSGVVISWQQTAGTLVVGGNSGTIRVWDLGREQNVRTFQTGVEACLTAISTTTVSNRYSSSMFGMDYPMSSMWQADVDSTPVTWSFAGFADGSVAIYDERVSAMDGRVHYSHTSSGWVNYTHLRSDVPEVIIGSVRGSVKFWDLRTMRTHKTLEVQKSPITSMAVHNCAPIMATGSHAQFIKILTLGGEQLGNIIKYYDGFLGERIGPISSLAFHPYKLIMAASSTTGLISLYHTTENKAT